MLDILCIMYPILLRMAMITAAAVVSFTNKALYMRHRYSIISSLIIINYFAPRAGFVKRSALALGGLPPASGGGMGHAKELIKIFFWSNTAEMLVTVVAMPLPLPLAPLTFILPLIAMSLTSENVCLAPFLDNPTFAGKIARHTKVLDSVTLSGILKWVGVLKTQEYNAQRQCEVWFSFFRIVLGGVIPHMVVLLFQLVSPLQFGNAKTQQQQQNRKDNKQRHQRHGSWLQRVDDCCLFVWKNSKAAFIFSMPPVFLLFIWLSAVWGILAPALASFMPQS